MEEMVMANECANYITIKGEKDLLQLFADSYLDKLENGDYGLNFNIIAPIPDDCENDYDFVINNWGNKWDGTNGYVSFGDNEMPSSKKELEHHRSNCACLSAYIALVCSCSTEQ
jgi:hypothetical protein